MKTATELSNAAIASLQSDRRQSHETAVAVAKDFGVSEEQLAAAMANRNLDPRQVAALIHAANGSLFFSIVFDAEWLNSDRRFTDEEMKAGIAYANWFGEGFGEISTYVMNTFQEWMEETFGKAADAREAEAVAEAEAEAK